jgi:hypothetical protein
MNRAFGPGFFPSFLVLVLVVEDPCDVGPRKFR